MTSSLSSLVGPATLVLTSHFLFIPEWSIVIKGRNNRIFMSSIKVHAFISSWQQPMWECYFCVLTNLGFSIYVLSLVLHCQDVFLVQFLNLVHQDLKNLLTLKTKVDCKFLTLISEPLLDNKLWDNPMILADKISAVEFEFTISWRLRLKGQ